MRRILQWLGWLFCAAGIALIGTSLAMSLQGLTPSYNFGDPTKFQFFLVPFWQLGIVIAVVGGSCLLALRWLHRARN